MTPNGFLKGATVLSVEQAVSLPYCTWRLALDGADVIRIESQKGDPNRKVGQKILDEELMSSYFLSVNAQKRSITLNLKSEKGQEILKKLISELNVDIFASNQLPGNYQKLGIDYDQIKTVKEDIIWLGVTGFGPDRSEAAYDPMIQAFSGIMDTNGEPGSAPLRFGISIADLEAANQGYCEIMKALLHREKTGEGSRIDVNMLDASMSLLALHIPSVGLGIPLKKSGNSHPVFSPVGVYRTADGYVSLAVGNEAQWQAMVKIAGFESLNHSRFCKNNRRKVNDRQLNKEIGSIMAKKKTEEVLATFREARIPISAVNKLEGVFEEPLLSGKLLSVTDKRTGLRVNLAPPPVALEHAVELSFPPRFGEHNEEIYGELGYEVNELKDAGII
ncbi:MAG: CoA transferase [Thermoplasmata archaeon]|nr:MAG: CoA transferase [Thermoplasmata archaeon]